MPNEIPPLESEQPVDYSAPRGIEAKPGDYRAAYVQRKEELAQRAAAAKERIAQAYQQANELKESRKAKMIDKLVPTKRRGFGSSSSGASRGGGSHASSSAFLHKPRADSRSTLLSKPGNQLKLLKDLGLVKPPPAKPAATVRVIKASPLPSAAVGHSSSLAGAALLAKATGGQLGRTSVGSNRGHVQAQLPHVAARAAAVAAAATANRGPGASSAGAVGFRTGGPGSAVAAAAAAGTKRSATEAACGQKQQLGAKAAKLSSGASASGSSGGSGGSGGGLRDGGPPRPDPRVMFPRQAPGRSPMGGSKFAVPTARPAVLMQPAQAPPPRLPPGQGKDPQPLDDL